MKSKTSTTYLIVPVLSCFRWLPPPASHGRSRADCHRENGLR